MKNRLLFAAATMGGMFLTIASALAQATPPPPPTAIPVDGGASILLAAGAAYGAKKYHDYRKSKSVAEEETDA